MKNVDTVKRNTLKKKIIVVICIAIILALIVVGTITGNKIRRNEYIKTEKETEKSKEKVSINVKINKETDTGYNCLITFTSNDENDKIKSIEYPEEEGKHPKIVINTTKKDKIALDYKIDKGNEEKKFKIITSNGNEIIKKTSYTINCEYDDGKVLTNEKLIGTTAALDIPRKDGYVFLGWTNDRNKKMGDYFRTYDYQGKDTVNLSETWIKVNNESMLGAIEQINSSTKLALEEEIFSINVIKCTGEIILDGKNSIEGATLNNKIYEFGDKENDVANQNEYAKNMVVLKVDGNLTIEEGVTLTACKSENGYGGPKGLLIYCTGTITNNGTIDMTARGAKAEGQNVYLWQNADNSYEYIPAIGATGAEARWIGNTTNGNNGKDGTNRQTGGGGQRAEYVLMVMVVD